MDALGDHLVNSMIKSWNHLENARTRNTDQWCVEVEETSVRACACVCERVCVCVCACVGDSGGCETTVWE